MTKVAIIQEAPCLLDKKSTIDKAVQIVQKVSADGAELVVFPEAFISGYPAWIWRLRPGGDWGINEELHSRLMDSSVDLGTDDLKPLQDIAATTDTIIVCGLNERDSVNSCATLYNSVVTIGADGKIINHHRKLMPTNPERMVWGAGDGNGLNVIETAIGKLGALICWENFMPLARYALYAQGVEIYIAPTYDSGEASIGTMQHIAREGRCWVLCCGVALERTDLPEDFPNIEELYPKNENWINPGDSVIVAPGGEVVAGPLSKEKGYLLLDIDPDKAAKSKRALDVAGHYARSDVFKLTVNKERQSPIIIENR